MCPFLEKENKRLIEEKIELKKEITKIYENFQTEKNLMLKDFAEKLKKNEIKMENKFEKITKNLLV